MQICKQLNLCRVTQDYFSWERKIEMRIACPFCDVELDVDQAQAGMESNCPSCNNRFQIPVPTAVIPDKPTQPDIVRDFAGKKIAAGICGILLGGFGVHKFILGFNSAGAVMLSVYLLGIVFGSCLVVPILGSIVMQVIGLVEGILYLTKTDEEFYQTYAVERRQWF